MMGDTAVLGFASRDWRRVGEPGLMLVELSVVEQRYHAVMEVVSGGVPIVEAAERYGVSRKTVHAWLRRYRQEGLPGLADRSHRPHHHPGQLASEIEARVCELRRIHPRWGPRRLVHELGRLGIAPLPSPIDGVSHSGPARANRAPVTTP
jgi:hypothetical protein